MYRSETDRMIGGVCGGLAEYLGIDSIWFRVVAVLLALADGLGFLAYLLLWIIVPTRSKVTQHQKEVAEVGGEGMMEEAKESASELSMGVGGGGYPLARDTARQTRAGRSYTVAAVLVLVGAIALAAKAAEFAWEARTSMSSGHPMDDFGLFWWLGLGQLWPLILIGVGVVVLLRRRRA